jgi:hypothetical protein
METIGQYTPATDQQKLSFKDQMKTLDSKHGYDPSIEKTPISKHDAKKRMTEMLNNRDAQDKQLKPERLFEEGEQISLKKFNEAFDKVHNRNEDGGLVPHNGVPSAWNDLGTVANYSSFDNLDNLYVNEGNRVDTGRQMYGSTNFGTPMKKITKEDMANMKGADYVDQHNVLSDEYYKEMKAKLRERNMDSTNLEKMKYNDFKRDDTAGYGIFDQLGFKFDDRLALDVDEDDISKKYEKLMTERQVDLLPGNNPGITVPPAKKGNQTWR